jgi:hypothetical protein
LFDILCFCLITISNISIVFSGLLLQAPEIDDLRCIKLFDLSLFVLNFKLVVDNDFLANSFIELFICGKDIIFSEFELSKLSSFIFGKLKLKVKLLIVKESHFQNYQ